MILTDLYTFERVSGTKSKSRIDCKQSTESYPQFEEMRNKSGELFMYLGDNTYTEAGKKQKSDLALSHTKHISSIYRPDVRNTFAYGDVKGTTDAILIVLHDFSITDGRINDGAKIEIFVARGYRNDRNNLYTQLVDGELNPEIEILRQQAQKLPQNRNVI